MTYIRFHAVFNLPILLLLSILAWWSGWSGVHTSTLAALLGIVLLFTYPWDSIAVRYGIWDFPNDRIIRRIGVLPVEEIGFFVIQTVEVALLTVIVLHTTSHSTIAHDVATSTTGLLLAILLLGVFMIARRTRGVPQDALRFHYARHLFLWFLPVVCLQWIVGWSILLPRLVAVLVPTIVIGTYLTLADVKAVREGIWFFDTRRTTGHVLFGILPWEECAFFYLTSLVVAQSIIILLPESAR